VEIHEYRLKKYLLLFWTRIEYEFAHDEDGGDSGGIFPYSLGGSD
jgi:hypothetical protein